MCSNSSVFHRQILIVLSALPLTRISPLGLTATDVTSSVCPVNVYNILPVSSSQILMVLSALALKSISPIFRELGLLFLIAFGGKKALIVVALCSLAQILLYNLFVDWNYLQIG